MILVIVHAFNPEFGAKREPFLKKTHVSGLPKHSGVGLSELNESF
jgi:hypothetical protein